MKPTVTCPQIGYEHQYEMFELVRTITGRKPLVIRAEHLVEDPQTVVATFCEAVKLKFLPHALSWRAADRPEWQRTRKWHIDTIDSTGFTKWPNHYPANIHNNAKLRSYYEYHLRFYELLVQHAI
jgi:hypothetical protein